MMMIMLTDAIKVKANKFNKSRDLSCKNGVRL
ncbi:hypothetical protein BACCIP111883_03372 [Sutcliffiella rhizosphaerae]|uniref:Uncharacterized protein n=1 Tax=Sutcliffiella rhizosphaerae TaxID=2880967 RepID=A0ABN8AET5_9BACI|nr:hypothetical protein BACCIP111883_03372 [Sutcliffiella rhizosphaerae]